MYPYLIFILYILTPIVICVVGIAIVIANKKHIFSKSVQQQALDIFLLELDEKVDQNLIVAKKEALKSSIGSMQLHWQFVKNNSKSFEQIKNISLVEKNKEVLVMIENKIHEHISNAFSDEDIKTPNNKICIDSLLSDLSISKKKLNEVLIKDGSFSQYYKNARLDYAAEYLKSTQIQLNKIQLMASYSDPASFREAFKKRHGLIPSKYRKLNSTA